MGFRGNVSTGLRWGMLFGGLYSAVGMIIRLVRGSGPFERLGMSFGMVVITYLLGGFLGGLVLGMLLPIARTKLGAAFVGFFTALPVVAIASFSMAASAEAAIVTTLIVAGFLGCLGGLAIHDVHFGR